MSFKVKEAVQVRHIPGCSKNKGCGPECKRVKLKSMFEAHILIRIPGQKPIRRRLAIPPEFSRTGGERDVWSERQHDAVRQRLIEVPKTVTVVPTISEFKTEFEAYGKANRQKASTQYAREQILKKHLVPLLGSKRLNEITELDVQDIKAHLKDRQPKTVNNVLATLSKMLRVAKRLRLITALPVETFELLKVRSKPPVFYDFDEYARLVAAAGAVSDRVLAMVLLAGDAGLRPGEIVALQQTDVNHVSRRLHVERQSWRGVVDTPKTNAGIRFIPMTRRLAAALGSIRHLGSDDLLVKDDGRTVTAKVLRIWMKGAQRRAQLKVTGNLYTLRHTFCSHVAMRGQPPKVLAELMGHEDIAVTNRYMHLTPGAKEEAIRALEGSQNGARMALAGAPGISPEVPAS
jgi:integrase